MEVDGFIIVWVICFLLLVVKVNWLLIVQESRWCNFDKHLLTSKRPALKNIRAIFKGLQKSLISENYNQTTKNPKRVPTPQIHAPDGPSHNNANQNHPQTLPSPARPSPVLAVRLRSNPQTSHITRTILCLAWVR